MSESAAACILGLKDMITPLIKKGVPEEMAQAIDDFADEVRLGGVTPERIDSFMADLMQDVAISVKVSAENAIKFNTMSAKVKALGVNGLKYVRDNLAITAFTKKSSFAEGGDASSLIMSAKDSFVGGMERILKKHKLNINRLSEDFEWDVARVMKGLEVDDPAAKELGEYLKSMRDEWTARAEASGKFVDVIPDYIPHHYEPALIDADVSGFAELLSKADMSRFAKHVEDPAAATAAELQDITRHVAGSVRSNQMVKMFAGQGDRRRKINFFGPEAAEAEIAMLRQFSGKGFIDIVASDMARTIDDVVMSEKFGPKWVDNIGSLVEQAQEKMLRENVEPSWKVTRQARDIQKIVKFKSELNGPPVNQTVASVTRGMLAWAQSVLLGKAVRYGAMDLMNVQMNTSAFKTANVNRTAEMLVKQLNDADAQAALDGANFLYGQTQGIIFERFAGGDGVEVAVTKFEKGAKIAATGLFKTTGQTAVTDASNRVHSLLYLREMGDAIRNGVKFKDLGGDYKVIQGRLQEYGISEKTWDNLTIEHLEGEYLNLSKIEDSKMYNTLAGFLTRENSIAITRPDLYTQAVFGVLKGTSGTGQHMVMSFLTQFHAMQMQFMRGMMARQIREGSHASVTKYMAASVVTGAVMYQMERLLNGDPPLNMDNPVLMANALDRSGILWWGGAMIAGPVERSYVGGGTMIDPGRFVGPVPQRLIRVMDSAISWAKADTQLENNAALDKLLRTGVSIIPWQNHILWAGIINDKLDDISRELNPRGANARQLRERKLQQAKLFER